jgi:predicted PurR-regulated permease PerM
MRLALHHSAKVSTRQMLRWILLALTAATLYLCWPLWPALVLAAWTSGLAVPLLDRLQRALKGRRRAAVVLSSFLFVGLALPLVAVVLGVVSGSQELLQLLSQQPSVKGALESIASGPHAPALEVPTNFASGVDLLERYGAQAAGLLRNLAGAAANGLIATCIYFGATYVFLLEGPALWRWIQQRSPLAPPQLARFAAAFHETGRGLLVGVGLTSATQGVVATLAYLSLGVPRWWVLGPITGLASTIPIFGSALVWGPVAAGLALGGHAMKASILVLIGIGIISIADNLLQPFYARKGSLEMPTFLLFVALFGGMLAFGTWGAVLGPLVVRLWLEALALHGEADPDVVQEDVGEAP